MCEGMDLLELRGSAGDRCPAHLSGSTGAPAFLLQWGHTMKNYEVLRRAVVTPLTHGQGMSRERWSKAFSEAGAQVESRVNDRRQALQEQGPGNGNQFAAQSVINIFPDGIFRTWTHDYSLFLCQPGKSGCDSCLLCCRCPCLVCWQGRGLLHRAPSGVLSSAAGCTSPV